MKENESLHVITCLYMIDPILTHTEVLGHDAEIK